MVDLSGMKWLKLSHILPVTLEMLYTNLEETSCWLVGGGDTITATRMSKKYHLYLPRYMMDEVNSC